MLIQYIHVYCIGAARLRLYYILKEFKSREFYFFTEETPLKSRSKQTLNSKVKQRQFKQFIANHRTLPDLRPCCKKNCKL